MLVQCRDPDHVVCFEWGTSKVRITSSGCNFDSLLQLSLKSRRPSAEPVVPGMEYGYQNLACSNYNHCYKMMDFSTILQEMEMKG